MKDLTPLKKFEELTVDSVVGKAYAKGFYYYKVERIETYELTSGNISVAWGKRVLKGTHEPIKKSYRCILATKYHDADSSDQPHNTFSDIGDSAAKQYDFATTYDDHKFDLIKV